MEIALNVVPLIKCPTKKEAQEIIRKLSASGKVRFEGHSKRQKARRKITDIQILNCLATGHVVDEPCINHPRGGWETTVVGKVTGDTLRVAVCIRWKQDILVITTYFQ
jgi:hypothetical protein